MSRKKASQYSDGGLEHLRSGINVERYGLYDVPDGGIKALSVVQHNESVKHINQC